MQSQVKYDIKRPQEVVQMLTLLCSAVAIATGPFPWKVSLSVCLKRGSEKFSTQRTAASQAVHTYAFKKPCK